MVIMTKELAKQLIDFYQETLEAVKEPTNPNMLLVLDFLSEKYIDSGICYCSEHIFNVKLDNCDWTNSLVMGNGVQYGKWWFIPPEYCDTIPQIIESLQCRIDLLKTF